MAMDTKVHITKSPPRLVVYHDLRHCGGNILHSTGLPAARHGKFVHLLAYLGDSRDNNRRDFRAQRAHVLLHWILRRTQAGSGAGQQANRSAIPENFLHQRPVGLLPSKSALLHRVVVGYEAASAHTVLHQVPTHHQVPQAFQVLCRDVNYYTYMITLVVVFTLLYWHVVCCMLKFLRHRLGSKMNRIFLRARTITHVIHYGKVLPATEAEILLVWFGWYASSLFFIYILGNDSALALHVADKFAL
ncbi:hypothetical protein D910_08256 [Dendroctonus ponderosae]